MPYSFTSVPKASSNAGRAKGKKPYILLYRTKEVITYQRNDNGVLLTDFALKAAAVPAAIYATESTINIYHTSQGDDDARGFIHHADFEHPGTPLEFDEFMENNINEEFIAIGINCDAKSTDLCKIAGTPGTPLKITKDDSQDNKDADKHTVNLASVITGPTLGRITKSMVPKTGVAEIDAILGLTTGSGSTTGGV
jgi:hypothetical protein